MPPARRPGATPSDRRDRDREVGEEREARSRSPRRDGDPAPGAARAWPPPFDLDGAAYASAGAANGWRGERVARRHFNVSRPDARPRDQGRTVR